MRAELDRILLIAVSTGILTTVIAAYMTFFTIAVIHAAATFIEAMSVSRSDLAMKPDLFADGGRILVQNGRYAFKRRTLTKLLLNICSVRQSQVFLVVYYILIFIHGDPF